MRIRIRGCGIIANDTTFHQTPNNVKVNDNVRPSTISKTNINIYPIARF